MAYWELDYLPNWEAPELASLHIQIPGREKFFFFNARSKMCVIAKKCTIALHIFKTGFLPIKWCKSCKLMYLYSPFRINRAR